MQPYKSEKLNKILIIVAVVLVVIAIISVILYMVFQNSKKEEDYEDKIIAKNYFVEMTVDFNTKEVKRDSNETTLKNEFEITDEEENLILSSENELINFFKDSTFEINIQERIAHITNQYQTKKIILAVDELNGKFNAEKVDEIQEGMYILTFDTQKRTKSAYEYLSTVGWVKNIEIDKVSIINKISDESQTVYGQEENTDSNGYKSYGVKEMGLDNYQNIIQENGNPSDITVATIGYGACIDNPYFGGRINENYYNFIEDSKNVYETIPQGSRILEVIQESTTHNVKIMPLVVVDEENYTTTASIIEALSYATKNSDVICYELVNNENEMINLALKNAFKENIPVCCVTTSEFEKDKNYPANNSTTIAVSSLNKTSKITNYSGRGNYVDFSAYSTDVEEIFNTSSSVSKWSGAQYSNAHIVAAIALIKTYHKDYTILETYNMLRNYCADLGSEGKDEEYGYGCPNFSELKISDIDTTAPVIQEVVYSNENWEKSKNIQIKATDEIRIYGWAITSSNEVPSKWNTLEILSSTLDVTSSIEKNGTYYVWVTDSARNTTYTTIEINKIDNIKPKIQYAIDDSKLQSEKYVTIKVDATDEESGLHETAYSWDGINWGADKNELKVTENGRYKIYVRDALENVSEKEIKVNKFEQEGVATIGEGMIIKEILVSSSWNGNTNDNVKITFNDNLKIEKWKITETNSVPTDFNNLDNDLESGTEFEDEDTNRNIINNAVNTNSIDTNDNSIQGFSNVTVTVSLNANTQYYAWIKDNNGNIISQAFTISKVEI